MSGGGGGEKKLSPVWHYMRTTAHSPPPPRPRGDDYLPPREILPQDLEPVRFDLEWRPSFILRQFGGAERDAEYLPRLIVACAVIQGVHRILELSERLVALSTTSIPRLKSMLDDDALAPRREVLKDLWRRVHTAKVELGQTRARAANDVDGEPANPDGLRYLDLLVLTSQTENAILAHEVTSRRNITGIDYGRAVASQLPQLRYAETWVERTLGTSEMNGVLLYWPPDYGRVLVVYEDGRLAYDPAAVPEEEGD